MTPDTPLKGQIEPVNLRCRRCNRLLRITVLPAMCPVCHTPVSVPNAKPADPGTIYSDQVGPTRSREPFRVPTWALISAGVVVLLLLAIFIFDDLRLRVSASPTPTAVVATPVPVYIPPPKPTPPPVTTAPQQAVVIMPATVPVTTPVEPPPPPHPFASLASAEFYREPPPNAADSTDDHIAAAITKGVQYLRSQFVGTRLNDSDQMPADRFEGLDTLCVYALLHAGLTLDDPTLRPQSPYGSSLLETVKTFPMNGSLATYDRSLRLALLCLFNRPEDHAIIESDFAWLLKSSINGAYTYTYVPPPPNHQPRQLDLWDNSNSQYGALGIWAAGDAGLHPAGTYWQEVTKHWESSQKNSGGWSYNANTQAPSLSMTAAGVSILFTARDQSAADNGLSNAKPTPLSPSIEDGLNWLDDGDNAVALSSDHPGYTLYGMERAGLASGYKFFGKHDWYLELAAASIGAQQQDGSWGGADGSAAETAFRLLFLSRGRHPVFLSKLRYDGDWAFRPRDVPNLTKYASQQLEVPLNWQTVGLDRSALEWSDSPVLLLEGDTPPTLSDADVAKLSDYVRAGGLLFTMSSRDSKAFTQFAIDLAARLFPDHKMETIPATHPIYGSIFALQPDDQLPLLGVSNGVRLLMVHAPSDLARQWHPRYERFESGSLKMGTNIVLYGSGRRDLRNRAETTNVTLPNTPPVASVPIARISYAGNWDPEPGAWERMAKLIQLNSGLHCDVQAVAANALNAASTPIAHLTGTEAVQFSVAELAAMTQFVVDGGVLLIDSCGGSDAFATSVKSQFIDKLGEPPAMVDADSILAKANVAGMKDLSKPRLRNYAEARDLQAAGHLFQVHHGNGDVVFTSLDLTSGLLGTHTWGITGYSTEYAQAVVNNFVIWGTRQVRRIVGK